MKEKAISWHRQRQLASSFEKTSVMIGKWAKSSIGDADADARKGNLKTGHQAAHLRNIQSLVGGLQGLIRTF